MQDDVKLKPHTITSNEVIDDPNMNIESIGVYVILCRHANNKTRKCWPSMNKIGEMLGRSRQSISRTISTLEDAGHIKVERERIGSKTRNTYTILDKIVKDVEGSDVTEDNVEIDGDVDSDVNEDNVEIGSDVNEDNTNYTTLNINYTNTNNLSKDKADKSAGKQKQSTLVDIPKPLDKPKQRKKNRTQREIGLDKIDDAKNGLVEWEKVTYRDFTFYYIERHNEMFQTRVEYNQFESVTIIRENFIKTFKLDKDEVCDYIDKLLEIYSQSPKNWGHLSFNMIRSNFTMMKDLMMRAEFALNPVQDIQESDEIRKQREEWQWKMDNLDKLEEDEIF